MTIQFYGIPNCDTVKKARTWLEAQGLDYAFHDYKKEGADAARLGEWAEAVGWEALLNRRGTTFRKLPEVAREGIDRDKAIALMVEQPSMIKRPVVEHGDQVLVGFDPAAWAAALG
ncbi:ArsC family reductase [Qipengyuania soli]|uniref:ArsC family reductase n=1 Tax=Qipengyuania soli TaxID=2782568 RepID=A0A7S8ITY3_9SPHN|nr:ArsC family reductase [Qipengyuania soli]QPC98434.1 ArsC family reductase [Qipengyuania soli]